MHRHSGRSLSNTPIGDYHVKAFGFDQKCVFIFFSVCMRVSFIVPLIYRCHWFVHLSDEILLGRIWFAIPVTAFQRALTDGIYKCSVSKCLELNPTLWSWKVPSKTGNILVRSSQIYLRARLRCMLSELKCTQYFHTVPVCTVPACAYSLVWCIITACLFSKCQRGEVNLHI